MERVEDKTISLNVPDIIEIHGIWTTSVSGTPSAPSMDLISLIVPLQPLQN